MYIFFLHNNVTIELTTMNTVYSRRYRFKKAYAFEKKSAFSELSEQVLTTDRPIDQPTSNDQATDRRTDKIIGKYLFR